MESLVKQFNQRGKGTEKLWLRDGAEAILQGRAAYLSEEGRGLDFYTHRPPALLSAETASNSAHERSCTPGRPIPSNPSPEPDGWPNRNTPRGGGYWTGLTSVHVTRAC